MHDDMRQVSKDEEAPLAGAEERSDEGPARGASRPDPEVPAKAQRRNHSPSYKLRILEELDSAPPGEAGAILRREGLYTSHISQWRKARHEGALNMFSQPRGRKPVVKDERDKRIAELEKKLARSEEELRKARIILDIQGKVAGLLGIDLQSAKPS